MRMLSHEITVALDPEGRLALCGRWESVQEPWLHSASVMAAPGLLQTYRPYVQYSIGAGESDKGSHKYSL